MPSDVLRSARGIAPGLSLAVLVAVLAYVAAGGIDALANGVGTPFSPVLLALVFGILARNLLPFRTSLHAVIGRGVSFGMKQVLRSAIVLMGIRLSLTGVLQIGSVALQLVVICVAGGVLITLAIAKLTDIPRSLAVLVTAGTSICGVSAVVALAPVIDADEAQTSYAVALVSLFGLLATVSYPYLVEIVLGFSAIQAGFFLGTAVHDTSQVTGAAMIHDQLWGRTSAGGLTVSEIALTVKLVRNTFLVAVIPLMGWWYRKRMPANSAESTRQVGAPTFPLFVVGYVAMAMVRSIGDVWSGGQVAGWISITRSLAGAAECLILVALACVGLHTEFRSLARLGAKPLLIGFTAAFAVGSISALILSFISIPSIG